MTITLRATLRALVALAAAGLALSACSSDGPEGLAVGSVDESPSTVGTVDDPSSTTVSPDATPTSGGSTSEPTETSGSETSGSETTSSEPEPTCSATGATRPGPQASLPDVVAERREAILTAALACDIEGLAALTGPSFTASFGLDDAVDVWTTEEDLGGEPLLALVEILRLDPTLREGSTDYIWPPAYGYNGWAEVPEAAREELRSLYDDDDFANFEAFGSYVGYRTVITEDGTWTAFVAGD